MTVYLLYSCLKWDEDFFLTKWFSSSAPSAQTLIPKPNMDMVSINGLGEETTSSLLLQSLGLQMLLQKF